MVSVVIPAHNEANVIGRCLAALLDGAPPDLDVVVVCNGCRDATAQIARATDPRVRVVETDVPSKSNALNLGDRAASGFPRFYLDADIILHGTAVRDVAAAMEATGVLAAAPLMRVDTSSRSWAVRAYYDLWLSLPYCRSGMIGSGVYALSSAGRGRFTEFPAITADDAFARLHFAADERLTVTTCDFTVTPPTTLAGIVQIKTRSHFGNEELRRRVPHLWRNEEARHRGAILRVAANPLRWPALAVYLSVKAATRLKTHQRFRRGEISRWERDDSSRTAAASRPHTAVTP